MNNADHMQTGKCVKDPETLKNLYDLILQKWPVVMKKVYVPTSLGKTLCIKSGEESNSPMILIHGSLSNSASWMPDIKMLNEKFVTYCLDVPGDPGGSEDRRFSWNGPYFSRWVRECMDFLNIDRAVLGGISLGGWAALRFAIDCPERVSKLLLLAPAGLSPVKTSGVVKLITLSFMGKWGLKKILQMLFNGKEITQEMIDYFGITSKNCKPRYGNPPLFSDEELFAIKVPVAYIGGENDLLIDAEKSLKRLKNTVDNCTSLILQKGHALIQLEHKVLELL